MLARVGLLTDEERVGRSLAALDRVEAELADGTFAFAPTDEDIHTAIERRVTEIAGAAGAKLHTGRSRNDQVALDLRLYLRREGRDQVARASHALQQVLLARGPTSATDVVPARATRTCSARSRCCSRTTSSRTSGRSARDVDRWRDCLGARRRLAARRGRARRFEPAARSRPSSPPSSASPRRFENSLDAVSDRDFVAEALFVAALTQVHLSRLGEEIVLWSTEEFGFLRLADAYATGSSMLPQKKNPDIAELARGKAGRLIGDLTGFLATLKGLPLAYNRDLQEDKEPLFDALDTCALVARARSPGCSRPSTFVDDRDDARRPTARSTRRPTSPSTSSSRACRSARRTRSSARSCGSRSNAACRSTSSSSNDPRLGPDALPLLEPGSAVRRRTTPGGGGPEPVARAARSRRPCAARASSRLVARALTLRASFYDRDALEVAPELLNKVLVAATASRRALVEVEAYRGADDPGSHAYRGQTPRNATMFGRPGHAVRVLHLRHALVRERGVRAGTSSRTRCCCARPRRSTGLDVMRERRPKARARPRPRARARAASGRRSASTGRSTASTSRAARCASSTTAHRRPTNPGVSTRIGLGARARAKHPAVPVLHRRPATRTWSRRAHYGNAGADPVRDERHRRGPVAFEIVRRARRSPRR